MIRFLAAIQGLYFLLTGVWPLINIISFQKVTGPKTDLWLVKTVGVLVSIIGLVLLLAGWQGSITFETALLALGSAAGLMAIDLVYVARRTILPIYLLDAFVQFILIAGWVVSGLWLLVTA